MKIFFKILAIVSIPPLLIGLIFFDNIKGYYRFKNMCEAEGGLRVYEKLERNVGWLADERALAGDAAMIDGVLFGRYRDHKDNMLYDVKYMGGDVRNDSSYEYQKASSTETVYEFTKKVTYLDKDNRLKKVAYLVFNRSKKVATEFNTIYYSAWGGGLGGPDWISCSSDLDGVNWKQTVKKAFKTK